MPDLALVRATLSAFGKRVSSSAMDVGGARGTILCGREPHWKLCVNNYVHVWSRQEGVGEGSYKLM